MKDFKILFFSSLLITAVAFAQWSTDPAAPQSLGSGVQAQLAATSDGGVYVAWLSDGNYHVYLQRLNSLGESQWSDNGMVVSDNANASWIAVYHLNLAVDSEDNAIITTVDQRTGGQWEVYAYKIAPDGSMLWGDDGVALTASGVSNMSPRLTVLLDNSVVVTWTHNDNSVLFQRISSSGALLWGTGILIVEDGASLLSPQPIVTAEEDVLIQWIRQTGPFWAANSELYLQKYDYDGNPQWINPIVAAGPVVFPIGNWSQQSMGDGDNGSFSAWTEMSGSVQNARVQHITGIGVLSWTGGADLSANSSNFHISPQLTVANDTQELMAVWKEKTGSQSQIGVYAQRLDSGGNQLWGSNGTAVVALNSDYDYLDISVAGFEEDIIAAYIEQSINMNGDIYAARLDAGGNGVWAGGAATVTNSGNPKSDMMIAEGSGCLFIAWTEGGSVYAHCLREDGTLGAPDNEPSTTYVPDDNFEQALIDLGYDDVLNDSVLTANISGVTSLDVNDKSISDLTGIEAFTALTWLECHYNQLDSLDVSGNIALTTLYCAENQLTSLDVSSNTALSGLHCWGNQLTSLDVSNNTALTNMVFNSNQLDSLDVSNNTALTHLYCAENQLTNLDVSNNTALEVLHCNYNQLTYLNMKNGVTDQLTDFNATNNSLTCIEVLDPAWTTANWTSDSGNIDTGVSFDVICGAEAQTHWYVDTTGSDGQGSGIEASPLATIQTAINATTVGDTISVAAGTYVENINFNGKNISVIGADRETTIIDGNQDVENVVTFESGEDSTTVLSGFTITNGAGILIGGSSPTLQNLNITNNWSATAGGGIQIKKGNIYNGYASSSSQIKNTIISYNYTQMDGGAVSISEFHTLLFQNVLIYGNSSQNGSHGFYSYESNSMLINITIANNSAGSGLMIGQADTLTLINSIISNNGISINDASQLLISYSNIQGGWEGEGNIDADPLFVDVANDDYHLADWSPCIGAGQDGVDMGAYENALGAPAEHIAITNDSLVVLEDSSSTIDLLDNDLILNITSYTLAIVDSADNGTVALVGDTALTYTPDENFFGYDTVSYRAFSSETADTGLVFITVTAVNDVPSSFALNEQDSVYITMANFDSDSIVFAWDESEDVDGDELTYHFTAELVINNQLTTEYDTTLSNNEMLIDYKSVFDEIYAAQAMLATIEWDVSVSDGVEEVMAENGPLTVGLNASDAVLSINEELLPEVYALHHNYPNPFNPVTTLRYDLPEQANVNIIIYDMLGRHVRTLVNTTQDAGFKSVLWNATNDYGKPVSAGVYLYQIQAGDFVQTRKMVLLK